MDDPASLDPAISSRPATGQRQALRDLATSRGCTVADLVREAVQALAQTDAAKRALATEKRLARLARLARLKAIGVPLTDLVAELDRLDNLRRWERGLLDDLDGLTELTELTEPAPTTASTPKLGIDLAEKHEDIRRLLAKFGMRACRTNGWGFEDLLSDVFEKTPGAISDFIRTTRRRRPSARTS